MSSENASHGLVPEQKCSETESTLFWLEQYQYPFRYYLYWLQHVHQCVRLLCTQISAAFKNFGVGVNDCCCLVAKLSDSDSASVEMDRVCAAASGRQLPLSSVEEFTGVDTIRKVRIYLEFLCFWVHKVYKYQNI